LPALHPELQARPQPPQSVLLVSRSTQAPLQTVSPDGHTHALLWQVAPVGHTVPQPPQLLLSVAVLEQVPLHPV